MTPLPEIQTTPKPADRCLPIMDNIQEATAREKPSSAVFVEEPKAEMRASPRMVFPFKQLVAPLIGGQMPWPEDFIEVECRDISQSGISLFLKRPPGYKELVICLGPDDSQIQMLAQVVRVQELESDDRHGFAVGCQFLRRMGR
jgi:hypothetical protein